MEDKIGSKIIAVGVFFQGSGACFLLCGVVVIVVGVVVAIISLSLLLPIQLLFAVIVALLGILVISLSALTIVMGSSLLIVGLLNRVRRMEITICPSSLGSGKNEKKGVNIIDGKVQPGEVGTSLELEQFNSVFETRSSEELDKSVEEEEVRLEFYDEKNENIPERSINQILEGDVVTDQEKGNDSDIADPVEHNPHSPSVKLEKQVIETPNKKEVKTVLNLKLMKKVLRKIGDCGNYACILLIFTAILFILLVVIMFVVVLLLVFLIIFSVISAVPIIFCFASCCLVCVIFIPVVIFVVVIVNCCTVN